MARQARSVIPGFPHQVTQWGNYDQPVFAEAGDYRRYLEWLEVYSDRYALDIWAYCLMPNHVHYVCVPKAEDSLARAFNTLHMRYAQYFNGKLETRGHLWRGRFLSCALDDRSVLEEVRFIETNPVRSGLTVRAEDYPWSSARSRAKGIENPVLGGCCFLTDKIPDWRSYLQGRGEEALLRRVRDRLRTGRPAGDASFVRRLEAIAGRRLAAMPRGRPRKNPAANGLGPFTFEGSREILARGASKDKK